MQRRIFTDDDGIKIETTYDNGIIVTSLVEPSPKYVEEVLRLLQIEAEQQRLKEETERQFWAGLSDRIKTLEDRIKVLEERESV